MAIPPTCSGRVERVAGLARVERRKICAPRIGPLMVSVCLTGLAVDGSERCMSMQFGD